MHITHPNYLVFVSLSPPLSIAAPSRMQGDADRARKHGMDEYISADPCAFNHHQLFRILQNLTLTYRLNEPVVSLGEYSVGTTH